MSDSLAECQTVAIVPRPQDNQLLLAGIVRRTYTIVAGRLKLADEQLPLIEVPELVMSRNDMAVLADESDIVAPKVATDVVVTGHVYAGKPATEVELGVAVGGAVRTLRAIGERRARVSSAGEVKFSAPEPFERLALAWELAYGGYDARAHELLQPLDEETARTMKELFAFYDEQMVSFSEGADEADREPPEPPPRFIGSFAYPRNPVGQGYFIDVERVRADGALLPRIEDPDDRLTCDRFFLPTPHAWINAPIAAGLGWFQHSWYPRFARLMGPLALQHDPPLRPIRETELGDGDDLANMPQRPIDRVFPRALQGAAPGLARTLLKGDEPVALRNLHPHKPHLSFQLPGEVPRLTLEPPDVKTFSPKPVLQTVRIEPDRDLVSLTWCGGIPIMSDLSEEVAAATLLKVRFSSG